MLRQLLLLLLLHWLLAIAQAATAICVGFAACELLVVTWLARIVLIIRVTLALPHTALIATAAGCRRCARACTRASHQRPVVHFQERTRCSSLLVCQWTACQQVRQHCCNTWWVLTCKSCCDCCCERSLQCCGCHRLVATREGDWRPCQRVAPAAVDAAGLAFGLLAGLAVQALHHGRSNAPCMVAILPQRLLLAGPVL
jgi:hypothetical protein